MRRLAPLVANLFLATIVAAEDPSPCGCPEVPPPNKTFYCDPVNGSAKGDGSKEKPFGSLQSTFAAKLVNGSDPSKGIVHAGDRLLLLDGHHGSVNLYGEQYKNTEFITVEAAEKSEPVLDRLVVNQCQRWSFRGITLRPTTPPEKRGPVVMAQKSESIRLEKLKISSFERDAIVKWTPEDWATSSATFAIFINKVTDLTIADCDLFGVHNGISVSGNRILIHDNVIDYFANDGIDITSCNTIVRKNTITNRYPKWEDGFHHDAIQGWTAYDEQFTNNVVIDGNFAFASTGVYPEIPAVPVGTGNDYMQGISVFDGAWSNLTITNNVVAAAAHHGISLYGVTDSVIANNTVVKLCSDPKINTWLGLFVGKKKSGSISPSNVTIRNNIVNRLAIPAEVIPNITLDNNIMFTSTNTPGLKGLPVTSPQRVFMDYDPKKGKFDLRLRPGSPAIGYGSRTVTKSVEERIDAGAIPFK